MAKGAKNPLNTVGFGVGREVSDSCVSWSTRTTMLIAISCRAAVGLVTLAQRDLGFVSVHKKIKEVDFRQLLPSARVICELALGKQDTSLVDIKCDNRLTTVLERR